MKKKIMAYNIALAVLGMTLLFTACSNTPAAETADKNLTKAADNFEVPRRITAINGITDRVLFTVEGFCSYTDAPKKLKVICKQPDGSVERTTLGLSDNVTYVVAQMGGVHVSLFHSRIIFRPESIIPNFDLSTSKNPTEGNITTNPSNTSVVPPTPSPR